MFLSVEATDLCYNNLQYFSVYNNIVALIAVLFVAQTSNL